MGFAVTGTTFGTGWTKGDQLILTYNSGASVGLRKNNEPDPPTVPFGTTSFTYTVPSTSSSDEYALTWHAGGSDFTWTCTPAATTTTTTTPTDSTNIKTLQNSITTTVAGTSGQVNTNAIDGGINDAFSPNGSPTTFGPTGAFVSINDEPSSQIATRAEEAFASVDLGRNRNRSSLYGDETFSPLSYAGGINKAPNYNKAPPRLDREWSVWGDLRYTGWAINDTTGAGNDLKGNQFNVTAGVGRKLNVDTVVGVVVGYENFKYDVASLNGSLKGDGETIGGYFARRFAGNLRFDAALAWTNVNYNATSGTATGSFTGSRWLASTGLTGTYKYNVYKIEPSAKVYMLWENESAWTDSLGTAQASRNFSAGRTALGAKVGRSLETSNGWTVTPNAGFYGDWRFQSDSAIPTGTSVANIGTGWSVRVTGGLAAKAAGGCMVSLDGEYGGIGASYKIWTGSVRLTMPFGPQSMNSR